jgi:hypothetical protein
VTDLPQIFTLLHDRGNPLGGRIGRAVIDVDDFILPSTVERRGDLGDQRTDVLGFVAYGHNDGNIDRGCVRRWQINTRRLSTAGLSWAAAGDACVRRLRRPLLMGRKRRGQPF